MFITLYTREEHYVRQAVEEICSVMICDDWTDKDHVPRISVATKGGSGFTVELNEFNVTQLQAGNVIEKSKEFRMKPEGYEYPEEPEHPMEKMQREMQEAMTKHVNKLAGVEEKKEEVH